MAYGMTGYIGLAKETTWGTPVTPTIFAQAMSESLGTTIDRFDTTNIFNGLYMPDDEAGVFRIGGDTVHHGHPEVLGHLLYAAFGNVATTTVLTTYKSHVFQCATGDVSSVTALPPYTLEIFRDVTSAQQYAGCNLSQLVIAGQPNQDIRCTASWLGKSTLNKARVAAASVTFPGSSTSPFTFDTVSVSLAGAGVDYIEAFSLTLNNNLEGVPTLNASTNIAKIQRTNPIQASISGTLGFGDIVDYQRFINQTEIALTINVTKAASFAMLLSAPRFKYTAFPLATPGRGRLTVGFEGMAYTPTGSSGAIAVTLKNNTGSY